MIDEAQDVAGADVTIQLKQRTKLSVHAVSNFPLGLDHSATLDDEPQAVPRAKDFFSTLNTARTVSY
jgi:hypothetical protein